MSALFPEYFLSGALELVTLAATLMLLSRMLVDAFRVQDFGKRIPREKVSLLGQRLS